jgi:hypothetical protein
MQDQQQITDAYYCGRSRPGGPVLILTTGAYVVAEYIEGNGNITYHRLVPAPQKAVIERWLSQRFPPPKQTPKPPAAPAKLTRRAGGRA